MLRIDVFKFKFNLRKPCLRKGPHEMGFKKGGTKAKKSRKARSCVERRAQKTWRKSDSGNGYNGWIRDLTADGDVERHPGPPEFWGPLLAANANETTARVRYGPAVAEFLPYVQDCGEDLYSRDDADYWLAHYIHAEYAKGSTARGTRKGHCRNALYGLEHFYPAFQPLQVSRRCIAGWDRLLPSTPYAPMHQDVVHALAAVMCLLGCHGAAVALLVSFDCWLRVSEVAGLRPGDVVDNRGAADPAGRGVAVYLETTKTGRRQAVLVESPQVADLLVA